MACLCHAGKPTCNRMVKNVVNYALLFAEAIAPGG